MPINPFTRIAAAVRGRTRTAGDVGQSAIERTQPLEVVRVDMSDPERARAAVRAVRDAEHRLIERGDPDPRGMEPDWAGGVASAENLENWASTLNYLADYANEARDVAAGIWPPEPEPSPGELAQTLTAALDNARFERERCAERETTREQLGEAADRPESWRRPRAAFGFTAPTAGDGWTRDEVGLAVGRAGQAVHELRAQPPASDEAGMGHWQAEQTEQSHQAELGDPDEREACR